MRKTKPFTKDWEALVVKEIAFVRRCCLIHLKDWNHAKDLAQDVLIVLLSSEANFAEGTNLKAWIRRICYNEFINHCRKANKEAHFETVSDVLYGSKAMMKTNRNEGEYTLLKEVVDKAINRLRDDEQQIMNLLIAGYKYDQIAEETGVNISAVRSKIFRARAKMENLIPSLNPNQAKRETVKSV